MDRLRSVVGVDYSKKVWYGAVPVENNISDSRGRSQSVIFSSFSRMLIVLTFHTGSVYFWPTSTLVTSLFSHYMTEKVILLSCVILFLNNGCKNRLVCEGNTIRSEWRPIIMLYYILLILVSFVFTAWSCHDWEGTIIYVREKLLRISKSDKRSQSSNMLAVISFFVPQNTFY